MRREKLIHEGYYKHAESFRAATVSRFPIPPAALAASRLFRARPYWKKSPQSTAPSGSR